MKHFGYYFFRAILKPIYKAYYHPRIFNSNIIDSIEGPLIIAGNHIHIMDQNNVIVSTKRFITYMAKREYFDSAKTRWFFKMTECIPVDRSIKDENATERALNVLKNGGTIGIFPEGTRNKTKDKLLPFKFGAVSMAKKTDATILPYAIVGTYKFRSKDLKVKFGEPFKIGDMELEEANKKLFEQISKMIDELKEIK